MNRFFRILVALCFALTASVALAGCNNEPPVDKSLYTGTWVLESGSHSGLSLADVSELRKFGQEVSLVLNEDGKGQLQLFDSEPIEAVWSAESNTRGTITFGEDSQSAMQLEDGKLVVTNTQDAVMTFARPGSAASPPPSSASASAYQRPHQHRQTAAFPS